MSLEKATDYNDRYGLDGGYLNPLFRTRRRDETRSNGRTSGTTQESYENNATSQALRLLKH
jgi:hypothetical protein